MNPEPPPITTSEPAGTPTCEPPCATAHQVAMTAVNEWLHRHANNLEFDENPGSLGECAAKVYVGCMGEFARHQCTDGKGEPEASSELDEPAVHDVIAMILGALSESPTLLTPKGEAVLMNLLRGR